MDALTTPISLNTPIPTRPTPRSPEQMRETAESFEATFLAQMLKPMFQGLSTEAPFGGGSAEETWRSFMVDEMAKKVVKSGGIGLSGPVMNEMLKMQEQRL